MALNSNRLVFPTTSSKSMLVTAFCHVSFFNFMRDERKALSRFFVKWCLLSSLRSFFARLPLTLLLCFVPFAFLSLSLFPSFLPSFLPFLLPSSLPPFLLSVFSTPSLLFLFYFSSPLLSSPLFSTPLDSSPLYMSFEFSTCGFCRFDILSNPFQSTTARCEGGHMSSGKRCASSRGTRIDLGQTLGCECVCVCVSWALFSVVGHCINHFRLQIDFYTELYVC